MDTTTPGSLRTRVGRHGALSEQLWWIASDKDSANPEPLERWRSIAIIGGQLVRCSRPIPVDQLLTSVESSRWNGSTTGEWLARLRAEQNEVLRGQYERLDSQGIRVRSVAVDAHRQRGHTTAFGSATVILGSDDSELDPAGEGVGVWDAARTLSIARTAIVEPEVFFDDRMTSRPNGSSPALSVQFGSALTSDGYAWRAAGVPSLAFGRGLPSRPAGGWQTLRLLSADQLLSDLDSSRVADVPLEHLAELASVASNLAIYAAARRLLIAASPSAVLAKSALGPGEVRLALDSSSLTFTRRSTPSLILQSSCGLPGLEAEQLCKQSEVHPSDAFLIRACFVRSPSLTASSLVGDAVVRLTESLRPAERVGGDSWAGLVIRVAILESIKVFAVDPARFVSQMQHERVPLTWAHAHRLLTTACDECASPARISLAAGALALVLRLVAASCAALDVDSSAVAVARAFIRSVASVTRLTRLIHRRIREERRHARMFCSPAVSSLVECLSAVVHLENMFGPRPQGLEQMLEPHPVVPLVSYPSSSATIADRRILEARPGGVWLVDCGPAFLSLAWQPCFINSTGELEEDVGCCPGSGAAVEPARRSASTSVHYEVLMRRAQLQPSQRSAIRGGASPRAARIDILRQLASAPSAPRVVSTPKDETVRSSVPTALQKASESLTVHEPFTMDVAHDILTVGSSLAGCCTHPIVLPGGDVSGELIDCGLQHALRAGCLVAPGEDSGWRLVYRGSLPRVTVSRLSPYTTYLVRVRAIAVSPAPLGLSERHEPEVGVQATPTRWSLGQAIRTSPPDDLVWDAGSAGAGLRVGSNGLSVEMLHDERWSLILGSACLVRGVNRWAVRIDATPNEFLFVGVATASAQPESFLGADEHGWGWMGERATYHRRQRHATYGEPFRAGDVLSVELDADAGTVTFRKNGQSMGRAFSGLAGELFPAVAMYSRGQRVTILPCESWLPGQHSSIPGAPGVLSVNEAVETAEVLRDVAFGSMSQHAAPLFLASTFASVARWARGEESRHLLASAYDATLDTSPEACSVFGVRVNDHVLTSAGEGRVAGVMDGWLWIQREGEQGAWTIPVARDTALYSDAQVTGFAGATACPLRPCGCSMCPHAAISPAMWVPHPRTMVGMDAQDKESPVREASAGGGASSVTQPPPADLAPLGELAATTEASRRSRHDIILLYSPHRRRLRRRQRTAAAEPRTTSAAASSGQAPLQVDPHSELSGEIEHLFGEQLSNVLHSNPAADLSISEEGSIAGIAGSDSDMATNRYRPAALASVSQQHESSDAVAASTRNSDHGVSETGGLDDEDGDEDEDDHEDSGDDDGFFSRLFGTDVRTAGEDVLELPDSSLARGRSGSVCAAFGKGPSPEAVGEAPMVSRAPMSDMDRWRIHDGVPVTFADLIDVYCDRDGYWRKKGDELLVEAATHLANRRQCSVWNLTTWDISKLARERLGCDDTKAAKAVCRFGLLRRLCDGLVRILSLTDASSLVGSVPAGVLGDLDVVLKRAGWDSDSLVGPAWPRISAELAEAIGQSRSISTPLLDCEASVSSWPNSVALRLQRIHRSVFGALKQQVTTAVLARTATPTSRPLDDYDIPADLPLYTVSRPLAATAASTEDVAKRLQGSVFGQLVAQLMSRLSTSVALHGRGPRVGPESSIDTGHLRIIYAHPMDDNQLRAFRVRFAGEGSDDYGGPYREAIISAIVETQTLLDARSRAGNSRSRPPDHAMLLPLLIPTPNACADQGTGRELLVLHPNPALALRNSRPKPAQGLSEECWSLDEDAPAAVGITAVATIDMLSAADEFVAMRMRNVSAADRVVPFEAFPIEPPPVLAAALEGYGVLLGIAARTRVELPLALAPRSLRAILGQSGRDDATGPHIASTEEVDDMLTDLEAIDASAARSLRCLLTLASRDADQGAEEPVEGFEDLHWTTVLSDGTEVEVCPGGLSRRVLFRDVAAYCRAALECRQREADACAAYVRSGLVRSLPRALLSTLGAADLQELLAGDDDVDVSVLRSTAEFDVDVSPDDPHVQSLWRVLESMSTDDRRLFLRFVSARTRLPRGASQHLKIQSVASDLANQDALLPQAHTCFFSLQLPRYSNDQVLRERLTYAIHNCTEMDGDFVLADASSTQHWH